MVCHCAYDKLMNEANTYGQPIASVVDLFIAKSPGAAGRARGR
jgi:hypothetical protein